MNKALKTQIAALEESFNRACGQHRNASDFDDAGRIAASENAVEACSALIAIYAEDFDQLKELARWITNRDSKTAQLYFDVNGESFEEYRARLMEKAALNAEKDS